MWNYGFGWGFFPGGLFWIILWIIPIWLFWGHSGRHRRVMTDEKNAEEILSERFAKGEINEEEYEKRLSVIRKHDKQ